MIALLFLGILAAWLCWRLVYARYWKKDLSVRAEFADGWVYEGDTSCLLEEITNDKILPVPALEVRLAMSRNLEFASDAQANTSVTDQSYKRDIFSLLTRQRILRRLPFVCRRRGYYEIKTAGIVATDLLSGRRYLTEQAQNTSMYVYPAQIDTRRIAPVCQAISGMVMTQNRIYPDPFEFSGIREYERTDPMKHINWKASASAGKLMVNQHDSTTSAEITVFLDVEDTAILKYEALVEESIRIVSSLCARLAKAKMEADVVSNGRDGETGELMRYRLPAGAAQMQALNQKLARLITGERNTVPIRELFRREKTSGGSGRTCIVVSKNRTQELERELAAAVKEGTGVLWVLPVLPKGRQEEEETPRGVTVLRWEVG